MKKPIIGVTPLFDRERDSYWMLPGYLEGLEQAGAIPIVLPLPEDLDDLPQLVSLCDGLLFTGGQDVSPALYGETPKPTCGEICPARDRMEQALLHLALERDLPVLGICRGIQFLNAVLGGTLYQDLPTEHPSQTQHHMTPALRPSGAHRDHSARHPSGGAAGDGAHRCEQLPPPGGEDPGALPDRNGLVGGRSDRGGLSAREAVRVGGAVASGVCVPGG